jgi:hypothetical protein
MTEIEFVVIFEEKNNKIKCTVFLCGIMYLRTMQGNENFLPGIVSSFLPYQKVPCSDLSLFSTAYVTLTPTQPTALNHSVPTFSYTSAGW